MKHILTGGSAFPNPNRTDQTGMTLRDYFAAMALQGILANHGGVNPPWAETDLDIAEVCYEMADVMMKVREA